MVTTLSWTHTVKDFTQYLVGMWNVMPIMGTFAIACNILQGMQELIESHVTLSIQAFVGLLHKNASWENVAGGLLLDPD